jgi:hypothetical protein
MLKNIFLENNIIVKLLSNDYLNILYGYIKIIVFVDFIPIILAILGINKDKIYNCF